MSRDTAFSAKSLSASEYVRELFEPADNVAILVRNRGSGKTVQRIARAETVASPEFQGWLAVQNALAADAFIGMNPVQEGAYNRTKANIKDIRHVYIDLDRKGDEALEAIRNSPQVPPPNFVLNTSPGKHQAVWKVTGFTQNEAESLLRSLANQFGGDPAATDSTRVLRLPGFANRKLPEEFIVQARHESDAVYTPRDFTIPEDSLEISRHPGQNREHPQTNPSRHISQSEHDWAYAKRALARGVDPQEVSRNIADFRAKDKHDPQDYARRTVAKAKAELNARTGPSKSAPSDPAEAERGF
jgi:hypothetical protein